MLLELKVQNFAIIDNLHIHFKDGLNILSGETGAGKSVLLKSLGLLMGLKGSAESIRSGSSQASIEGSFDLSTRPDVLRKLQDMGIEIDEDVLVVRRLIGEEKSKVYLNGTLSTLNNLRDVVAPLIEVAGHAAPLIEMTGQHENRHLLSKSYHLDLLDQYAGTWEKRTELANQFEELQQLNQDIEKLKKDSLEKEQKLDFLRYQVKEIEALGLQDNADMNFEVEIKKLRNATRLAGFADNTEDALYTSDDSAVARLHAVLAKAHEFANVDPQLNQLVAPLQQAKTLIEDAVYEIRNYSSQIEADPVRLETLESQLSDFRKLQKKYGSDIQEILNAYEKFKIELNTLESSDENIESMQKQAQQLHKKLVKLATDIHQRRTASAKVLENSVNAELLDLNMKGVTFHVQVQEQALSSTGTSDVEFMSRTSAKDPLRPLAKFASGGELSRVLLSLKRVIGSSQQPRTYLFDEVDTGVSGETAQKVGRKLKSIAKGQQVICVTHLPQVAAYGDAHFFIQKSPTEKSSKTAGVSMEVLELQSKTRVQEIARLISGEKISKTSLAHAEQLLQEARP